MRPVPLHTTRGAREHARGPTPACQRGRAGRPRPQGAWTAHELERGRGTRFVLPDRLQELCRRVQPPGAAQAGELRRLKRLIRERLEQLEGASAPRREQASGRERTLGGRIGRGERLDEPVYHGRRSPPRVEDGADEVAREEGHIRRRRVGERCLHRSEPDREGFERALLGLLVDQDPRREGR